MVFPRRAAAGLILAAAWITPARAELVLFHGTGLAAGGVLDRRRPSRLGLSRDPGMS